MTTQSSGQIIYYDSDGGPLLCTVTAADVEAMERSREFYRVRVQALHELLEAPSCGRSRSGCRDWCRRGVRRSSGWMR